MNDVQVAFGILTYYFMQRSSYLLRCTLSFFTFTNTLFFFDFSLLQMFGCLLGSRSFDSLEGLLAHKQTSLPITFSGVELISTSTIALTTYLRSWALIAFNHSY
jgi:hypothetical protein